MKKLTIRNSYKVLTSSIFNFELLITNFECEAQVPSE